MRFSPQVAGLLLSAVLVLPTSVFGCASCGAPSLSDWESQGLTLGTGLKFDLRYDYVNQTQVRGGTSKATWPAGHEQESFTTNHYVNVGLDYSWSRDWGLNLRVPYIDRDHASDAGTSHDRGIGDVRLVGRYQGFLETHNLGVQLGVKLPTGRSDEQFRSGPSAGGILDRGLQLGSGTTDVITGVYYFGQLAKHWSYFSEATLQVPLNNDAGYRPGASVDTSAGIRYTGLCGITPQLQVTPRFAMRDRLSGASDPDSGGTTVYLSPGVTVPVTSKVKVYAFLQVPVYQNLNGYQLAPRYVFSVGTRFAF
jgi:hypothetical protein